MNGFSLLMKTHYFFSKGITEESFLKDDFVTKVWPKPASNIAVWTTIPKSTEPVTFLSVLAYARQVGDAAKSGYGVVFRQPRMHELVAETPVSNKNEVKSLYLNL